MTLVPIYELPYFVGNVLAALAMTASNGRSEADSEPARFNLQRRSFGSEAAPAATVSQHES